MTTNLVILGRDGVINEDPGDSIKSPQEWRPLPGALEALAALTRAGFRTVVATNQPGIKRRTLSVETLNLIHDRLHQEAAQLGGNIEAIFFCPCLPKDACDCYKPNPGMLEEIARRLRVNLAGVPTVGNSLADIEAARAAGAEPHLILTGDGRKAIADPAFPAHTTVHEDLARAVEYLVARQARSA